MRKILLCLMIFCLFGCSKKVEEVVIPDEPVVIPEEETPQCFDCETTELSFTYVNADGEEVEEVRRQLNDDELKEYFENSDWIRITDYVEINSIDSIETYWDDPEQQIVLLFDNGGLYYYDRTAGQYYHDARNNEQKVEYDVKDGKIILKFDDRVEELKQGWFAFNEALIAKNETDEDGRNIETINYYVRMTEISEANHELQRKDNYIGKDAV